MEIDRYAIVDIFTQRLGILILRTENKKPLDLEKVVLLLMHVKGQEKSVLLGVASKRFMNILGRAYSMARYEREIFSTLQKATVKHSRPVYITVVGQNHESVSKPVATEDVCALMVVENMEEIRKAGDL